MENKQTQKPAFLFGKKNYVIMITGLVFIALGFVLMSGGGSDNPAIFNEEIYNWQRIRLAPTLVILGLGIVIYAILVNPN